MKYSEEVKKFIAENVPGVTTKDLVVLVNAEFGLDFTESKMKSYKTNHKLKSGTPTGISAGKPSKQYPEEIRKFIIESYVSVGPKDMAELLNNTFGTSYTHTQLKGYYANHKLNSGITGFYPKGHVPANKGKKGHHAPGSEKGWFQKGHIPVNHRQVGSERVDTDGYVWIKVKEPNVWYPKHKVIWEAENGNVPDGYVITFLDGNKENIQLDNLALITMAESLELTRSRLRYDNGELTKTGILITKVKIAGRKLRGAI